MTTGGSLVGLGIGGAVCAMCGLAAGDGQYGTFERIVNRMSWLSLGASAAMIIIGWGA